MIAAERGQLEQAATLLGQADGLRNDTGVGIPTVLQPDVVRAREAAMAALGADACRAAYERGAHAVGDPDTVPELAFQRRRGHRSAPSRMLQSSRTSRDPHPRRIP